MRTLTRYIILFYFILSFVVCSSYSIAQENNTQNSQYSQTQTNLGELWTGSLYTSTYRAGLCIESDGRVRGVLLLKLKNGQIDTYHFYGIMDSNGIIKAKHKSGHLFVGKFDDEISVSGDVTLSNGFSVELKGDRLQNATLTERCGPLAE